ETPMMRTPYGTEHRPAFLLTRASWEPAPGTKTRSRSMLRTATLMLTIVAGALHAEPGVTPTSVLIGQSAAFSGAASELGTEMRAGAAAYFRVVNAAGGINGRKIELRSLDDG